MSKKFYTAGFAFENDKVLLIRKEQQQWQQGFLNGIGGKIESHDLTVHHAQAREFTEETALISRPDDWNLFDVEDFSHARIYWFWAEGLKIHQAIKTTNEMPEVHQIRNVINDLDGVMALYNVPYLLSKAHCFRRNRKQEVPSLQRTPTLALG